MNRRDFLSTGGIGLGTVALGAALLGRHSATAAPTAKFAMSLSDAEWHKRLTEAQYYILREEGTERPFTSALNDEHRHGVFACAGCGTKLYRSDTKFDSHTGWPSFYAPIKDAVAERQDRSFGMLRREVHCATCGGHLGHVFEDGPKPTGLRYCMNGYGMTFEAA